MVMDKGVRMPDRLTTIIDLFREGQNSRLEEMTGNIDGDLKKVYMIGLLVEILISFFSGWQ